MTKEIHPAYRQIVTAVKPRIAALNKTCAIDVPHNPMTVPYAPGLVDIMKKNKELVPGIMEHYDELIGLYNSLASHSRPSPLLALFPHTEHMRNIILNLEGNWEFPGFATLPTLKQLQTLPYWNKLLKTGIEEAAAHIEIGNNIDPANTDTPADFKKWLINYSVYSPARKDIDEPTRLFAVMGHVVERIYFNWMRKNGYEPTKDEFLHVIDDMVQYARLTGKPSPMEQSFMKLGWIKQDRLDTLQKQFDLDVDELPGAKPGVFDRRDHPHEVFYDGNSPNLYEDPNPLQDQLLAMQMGHILEEVAQMTGQDINKPFSAVFDTGEGITTVAFGPLIKRQNSMDRYYQIRTRSRQISGFIDHCMSVVHNPDNTRTYRAAGAHFVASMTHGHVHVQMSNNWTRTYEYSEHPEEFHTRPSIPRMLKGILSQVGGTPIDAFALKYPDAKPRQIACEFLHAPDAIVDEVQDVILVPVKKKHIPDLARGEILMKRLVLSEVLKETRETMDPLKTDSVCDDVFRMRYGPASQPVTTRGGDDLLT